MVDAEIQAEKRCAVVYARAGRQKTEPAATPPANHLPHSVLSFAQSRFCKRASSAGSGLLMNSLR